jgi:hypothetical protein
VKTQTLLIIGGAAVLLILLLRSNSTDSSYAGILGPGSGSYGVPWYAQFGAGAGVFLGQLGKSIWGDSSASGEVKIAYTPGIEL